MDALQAVNPMYAKIDPNGFFDGYIAKAAVNEHNQHLVVEAELPEVLLQPLQSWRWQNSQWTAATDHRGHSWYNPDNTDEVFEAKKFDDVPPQGWTWWQPGQTPVITPAEALRKKWAAVRAKRDKLLAESDWVAIRAADQGTPVPKAWKDYRQALRDITQQTTDPDQIVWPVKPSA